MVSFGVSLPACLKYKLFQIQKHFYISDAMHISSLEAKAHKAQCFTVGPYPAPLL